mmetsp:Transcript_127507/g.207708  ORF Transcript_127507/g.207708 Transcript_127507/m.207708 type:complete len:484 (+) Transcript_127507:83-1534(+)
MMRNLVSRHCSTSSSRGWRQLSSCMPTAVRLVSSSRPFLSPVAVVQLSQHGGSDALALGRPGPGRLPQQARRFASSPGDLFEQKVPEFGAESITEGTIMEWKKNPGDPVAKGDVLVVIETDKVTVEVNAAEAGTVKEHLVKVDDTVEVGVPLVKIAVGEVSSSSAAESSAPTAAPAPSAPVATSDGLPLVVTGFGALKSGFLRAAALRRNPALAPTAAAAEPTAPIASKPTAATPVAPAPKATPVAAIGRGDRRVPMSFVRQLVAKRLKDAQNTAALLTTFQEVDMTAVLEVRSKYKELFGKTHGAPLGFLSIFAKASCVALAELPGVNGIFDEKNNEIVYRDFADINLPIPTPRGIVSCTLRNAESMSIKDMECEISRLMAKARRDELTPEDMLPPTFGIVDSGSAGGWFGTQIINPPMSAVMGTNAVKKRPAVVGGKVVARPMMNISLTYDHRLIDGREAVTFLVSVRDKVEDPVRLLLDL